MLLFLIKELLNSNNLKELEGIYNYQKLKKIELTKKEEEEFFEAYRKKKKELEELGNTNFTRQRQTINYFFNC